MVMSFIFLIFIYLFGCVGSSLWHMGSSLRHVGSFLAALIGARGLFVAVRGLLSSCGPQAPERVGSVVCGMGAL